MQRRRLGVYLVYICLLTMLIWPQIIFLSRAASTLSIVLTPVHEMGHIGAIRCVECFHHKRIWITEVNFFNADLSSRSAFVNSIVEMTAGARKEGYVRWRMVSDLSWEEKYFIGLSGALCEVLVLLVFWWGSWKVMRHLFDPIGYLDIYSSALVFHASFLTTIIFSLKFALGEAEKMGMMSGNCF